MFFFFRLVLNSSIHSPATTLGTMSLMASRLHQSVQRTVSLLSTRSATLPAHLFSFNQPHNISQQPFLPTSNNNTSKRFFSTSETTYLKEIISEIEGNKMVVEAKYVASPREGSLIDNKLSNKEVCPLCTLNLNLKHTDVLVLSQFVRPDGRILPRRISGLCCSQQYRITHLITMAKKAGLMPNLAPANSHRDPAKRRRSKKFNRYFDETTIKDTKVRNVLKYRPELGVSGK